MNIVGRLRLLSVRPLITGCRTVNINTVERCVSFHVGPDRVAAATMALIPASSDKRQLYTSNFAPLFKQDIASKYMSTLSQSEANIPEYKKKDHHTAWIIERIMSMTTFFVIPFTFMYHSMGAEMVTIITIGSHSGWGIECIVKDYLREKVVGKSVAKLAEWIAFVFVFVVTGALAWTVMTGKGVVTNLKQLWYLEILPNPFAPEGEEKSHFQTILSK